MMQLDEVHFQRQMQMLAASPSLQKGILSKQKLSKAMLSESEQGLPIPNLNLLVHDLNRQKFYGNMVDISASPSHRQIMQYSKLK